MQLPDFGFERRLWQQGYKVVVGADEVGRGALAGPVVAGAVAMPNDKLQMPNNIIVNDSKKLTQKMRERASIWIKENALSWSIGEGSVTEINRLGLVRATQTAFRRALNILISQDPNIFLLVDAFYLPWVRGISQKSQTAIKKGDTLSFSIAAASIVAKVYRDDLMVRLAQKHPHYLWHQNKGYGTRLHQEALAEHGPCRHHRISFVNSFLSRVQ